MELITCCQVSVSWLTTPLAHGAQSPIQQISRQIRSIMQTNRALFWPERKRELHSVLVLHLSRELVNYYVLQAKRPFPAVKPNYQLQFMFLTNSLYKRDT